MPWTLVMVASNSRIEYKTCKVALEYRLDITPTTSNHANIVTLEFVLSPLTHISGKHQFDTHLLEVGSYTRFTATTLW